MTTKEMQALRKYNPVYHKWLGECIVMDMPSEDARRIGPQILPVTKEGLFKLFEASKMPPGVPTLCSDYKQNLKSIPRP